MARYSPQVIHGILLPLRVIGGSSWAVGGSISHHFLFCVACVTIWTPTWFMSWTTGSLGWAQIIFLYFFFVACCMIVSNPKYFSSRVAIRLRASSVFISYLFFFLLKWYEYNCTKNLYRACCVVVTDPGSSSYGPSLNSMRSTQAEGSTGKLRTSRWGGEVT